MLRSVLLVFALASIAHAQEGTRVFIQSCIRCHNPNSEAHAPMPEELAKMPWQTIVKSLETGDMKAQGAALSPDERRAVARYLGSTEPVAVPVMTGACAAGSKPTPSSSRSRQLTGAWNGWGADDRNTRFQPASAAKLEASQVPKLQVKWAFGFPTGTTAYGQPTVVNGRLFIGSNDGTIYGLDARSGCVYWQFQASALVRDAAVVGPDNRVYIGDLESRFYALDGSTGKLVWQRKLDNQPFTRITGTAKLHDGILYVPIASQEENAGANPQYPCCTFRGNVMALRAKDGSVVWKSYTSPEPKPTGKSKTGVQFYGPSGATIWSSPTIDENRKLIYVMTGNGYSGPDIKTADAIVAMDMATGAIRWWRQANPDMFNWDCGRPGGNGGNCPENAGEDVDFGSSAILVTVRGRDLLVAGQKSGVVHAFDPDRNGEIVWQTRIGKGGKLGGVLWGITEHDGIIYAPLSDQTRGDPYAGGGLFALDAGTGKVLWKAAASKTSCEGRKRGCSVAQTAPATAIPGIVFSGSMDGHMRAYDMKSGSVVWDFDAARDFNTVNGIPAKGGSFSATGPTVVDGVLYTTSGYSGIPGNVLLAFSPAL